MRRLILMRHAKSDWSHGRLADHDRPLNKRGRLAAPLMGAYLRETDMLPDLALVSSATRAAETWMRMGLDTPSRTEAALYHATPQCAFDLIRSAPDTAKTLLLLWHQPGIQDTANALLSEEVVETFPTAKIAVITFESSSWADIRLCTGALTDEAAPKDLV